MSMDNLMYEFAGYANNLHQKINDAIGEVVEEVVDACIVTHLAKHADSIEPQRLAELATKLLQDASRRLQSDFLDSEEISDKLWERFQENLDNECGDEDETKKLQALETEYKGGRWRVVVKEEEAA